MVKKSEKKAAAAKRTSAGRPVQPKCDCGKALYKRMDAGPVKTSDPYGWCRNPDCDHYNKDQSGESRFSALDASEAKPKSAGKAAVDAALGNGNGKKPKQEKAKASKLKLADRPAKADKPVIVAETDEEKARKRIAKIIKRGGTDESVKASLGMVLAILNEQTGSKDAGNALVTEFKLDSLYGIGVASEKKKRSKKRSKKSADAAASAS